MYGEPVVLNYKGDVLIVGEWPWNFATWLQLWLHLHSDHYTNLIALSDFFPSYIDSGYYP